MKEKVLSAFFAAAALVLTAPVSAQDDDLLSKVVNAPLPAAFYVNGLKTPPKPRTDPGVQGEKALRIKVPGKGANNWDISVGTAVQKPIKAGDELLLTFWARLEEGEGGATSTQLPFNAVQLSKDPYTPVFFGPATITSEWKMHEVKGRADRDYAAGELGITLHLATAKQVVDIGPIFLLNMSQ